MAKKLIKSQGAGAREQMFSFLATSLAGPPFYKCMVKLIYVKRNLGTSGVSEEAENPRKHFILLYFLLIFAIATISFYTFYLIYFL